MELARDIIHFGTTGDVQGAVIGMCLLREHKIVEAIKEEGISGNILEGWFFDYLDIITKLSLFTHKAQIVKLSPLQNIRTLDYKGMYFYGVMVRGSSV